MLLSLTNTHYDLDTGLRLKLRYDEQRLGYFYTISGKDGELYESTQFLSWKSCSTSGLDMLERLSKKDDEQEK